MDEVEERIESLKQQRAKDKSAFTKTRNKLLGLLDEEECPSRREVRAICDKLSEVQEYSLDTMQRLSQEYLSLKDKAGNMLTYDLLKCLTRMKFHLFFSPHRITYWFLYVLVTSPEPRLLLACSLLLAGKRDRWLRG